MCISIFFFFGIIPFEGSKMKPSAFSMLNNIFCSDGFSKYMCLVVSVLTVMKSKSIRSGIDAKIFEYIFLIFNF